DVGKLRVEELRCSCRALGILPPIVWDFDGKLGEPSSPPWENLSRVEKELRRVIAEVRPDVILTWGPEGGYGHPEHRLVGHVVTQIVRTGGDGVPTRLFYPNFPADRLKLARTRPPEPYEGTDPRYLTVRVTFTDGDWRANERALSCYKSQFAPDELARMSEREKEIWNGFVYLRPWFGVASADDLFAK